MKRWLALLMAGALLLTTSCDKVSTDKGSAKNELSFVYSGEDTSHNYLVESLSTITEFSYTTVDGLVGYDKYGRTRPLMATKYEVSEDGLKWTFKIREGVKWYTYDKKEYADVTAHDFVAGIKYVLTKENASKTSNLVYQNLVNAKEYYEGEITDFSKVGVKAIDDYTLEYTLIQPAPYFLGFMSYGCWYPVCQQFLDTLEDPKLLGSSNDTMLYNGPYINTVWEHETRKVRELNENYWDVADYSVKTITDTFNKEAGTLAPDLFLRGEVTSVGIGVTNADEWMNNEEKRAMLSYAPVSQYSWQYFFNFDPKYEDEYRPDQWKICANNLNFRKAIWHGTDVERLVSAIYPYTWKGVISSTPTLPGMFNANGTDYTKQPALAKYTPASSFDKELALEYKKKAMEELKDKVEFPIPLVFPHNTDQSNIDRAIVFEQMLEENLGKDFLDVVLVQYPNTGFTTKVMGAGLWSFGAKGWGPDYADPASTLEMYYENPGAGMICGKTWMAEDYAPIAAKLDEAMKELVDNDKRMKLFSEAEAMILEGAYSLPTHRTGGGLVATYRDPFSQDCTQFGRNTSKLNKVKLLEKPLGFDEYDAALAKWEKEKAEAAKDPDANWK